MRIAAGNRPASFNAASSRGCNWRSLAATGGLLASSTHVALSASTGPARTERANAAGSSGRTTSSRACAAANIALRWASGALRCMASLSVIGAGTDGNIDGGRIRGLISVVSKDSAGNALGG